MKAKISKKTRAITLATILTVFGVTSLSLSLTGAEYNAKTKANCQVTESEVIDYLEGYGYSNIVLTAVNGSTRATACDWIADTDYSYDTYVDCTETAIISHEDLQ